MRELLGKRVNVTYESPTMVRVIGVLVDIEDCYIGVEKGSHITYIPINRIYTLREVISYEDK